MSRELAPLPRALKDHGTLVDIGGRRLHCLVTGNGGPTVVLEAGMGDTVATWSQVQPALAVWTTVCSYDRAGLGSSDPASGPRTATAMVDDLRALLTAAGLPGPYLLVGHSFGGQLVRLFAGRFPDEVIGLVLVDSSHEDKYVRFEQALSPDLITRQNIFLANPTRNSENIDLVASSAQVRAARRSLPMPITVLTRGLPDSPSEIWPSAALQAVERDLQCELIALSPTGCQIIAATSGHFIQQDQPALVIAAIHDMLTILHHREPIL
jgi:pimeloyl-ACP methyl ester carboxylesterase